MAETHMPVRSCFVRWFSRRTPAAGGPRPLLIILTLADLALRAAIVVLLLWLAGAFNAIGN